MFMNAVFFVGYEIVPFDGLKFVGLPWRGIYCDFLFYKLDNMFLC